MQEYKQEQALITVQKPKHFLKWAFKLKESENECHSGFFGCKQQKPRLTHLRKREFIGRIWSWKDVKELKIVSLRKAM